ncbi:MAG: hypothetical protein IJ113_00990 [Eggerthellaceae bacterium]|nr:hypothetical protein [Eggerthellaceae bacterium]
MLDPTNYNYMLDMQQREFAASKRRGDRIWRMHCVDAMPPSEIAAETGMTADDVRYHITAVWLKDRRNAR